MPGDSINDLWQKINNKHTQGNAFSAKDKFIEAEACYREALDKLRELKKKGEVERQSKYENSLQDNIHACLFNQANEFYKEKKFSQAITYFEMADLQLSELDDNAKASEAAVASKHINISDAYLKYATQLLKANNFPGAIKNYLQTLEELKTLPNTVTLFKSLSGLANAYHNYAIILVQKGDYIKALENDNFAIETYDKLVSNKDISKSKLNLCLYDLAMHLKDYAKQLSASKNFEDAIAHFRMAIKEFSKIDDAWIKQFRKIFSTKRLVYTKEDFQAEIRSLSEKAFGDWKKNLKNDPKKDRKKFDNEPAPHSIFKTRKTIKQSEHGVSTLRKRKPQ
jgi:tetratricopeptide (TPR) repeat protein